MIHPDVEMLLRRAIHDKMYGELAIKLEAGRVVLIKETTTYKPVSDRNIRSDEDDKQ